jgi:biopolymer transport protein TolR
MSISAGKGRKRRRPMADINVTPLVDVMLVLLVIFMITAPALKDGVDIELPRAHGSGTGSKPATPMTVSIDPEGRVHVGGEMLEPAQIHTELPKLLKGHEKETITLKAHRKLPYEQVVRVISELRNAGVSALSIAWDRE